MNLTGNKRAPKHTKRFVYAKAGSPKRRESHGDGTPILPEKNKEATLWEGAAHEGGPECVNDTHAQGRYQEVMIHGGMRNADNRSDPRTSP
jgi:hypothetical protein